MPPFPQNSTEMYCFMHEIFLLRKEREREGGSRWSRRGRKIEIEWERERETELCQNWLRRLLNCSIDSKRRPLFNRCVLIPVQHTKFVQLGLDTTLPKIIPAWNLLLLLLSFVFFVPYALPSLSFVLFFSLSLFFCHPYGLFVHPTRTHFHQTWSRPTS